MSDPLLTLQVRRKAFGQAAAPVLAGVALTLGRREVVALLGPSGCGKTTLLRIAAGLDREFAGTLAWSAGAAPRLGMVFQQPLLLPWRTVRENLALVLPDRRQLPRALALLDAVGLGGSAEMFPEKLSLGMARRAAIVRALAVEPELLLLDEPFVSLDPAVAARARTVVIEAWRARPTAVLLVSHDAAEAAALADRVLLLASNPGRIAGEVIVPQAERRSGEQGVAARVVAAIARARSEAGSARPDQ